MSSNSSTRNAICPLPWLSMSFNTDSSARVCCNTDHGGSIKRDSEKLFLKDVNQVSDVMGAQTLIRLKKDMLAGVRSEFCRTCYRVEDAGGVSIRQFYLSKYQSEIDKIIATGEKAYPIKFLDFSLSNNCNLKCRMCGPGASYSLSNDFQALGMQYDREYSERAHTSWKYEGLIQNMIESEDVDLRDMLFTGGEPLTNSVHLKILESLVANKKSSKIALTYHSNLMVLPEKILNLWRHFKKVYLHLSLEGHGAYNDYIRHKSDFAKISMNLESLLDRRSGMNLWVEIHTVFQAYSFMIIPEYLEFLKAYEKSIPCFPYFIWLDNPNFLAVDVLPLDIKREGIRRIDAYLKANEDFYSKCSYKEFVQDKIQILKACLARVNLTDDPNALSRFQNYTIKLDQMRNQNVTQVFPDLKGAFPNYG